MLPVPQVVAFPIFLTAVLMPLELVDRIQELRFAFARVGVLIALACRASWDVVEIPMHSAYRTSHISIQLGWKRHPVFGLACCTARKTVVFLYRKHLRSIHS